MQTPSRAAILEWLGSWSVALSFQQRGKAKPVTMGAQMLSAGIAAGKGKDRLWTLTREIEASTMAVTPAASIAIVESSILSLAILNRSVNHGSS